MGRLTGLILLLLSSVAYGADYPRDVSVDWINASEYVDGSPIQEGELEAVRIEIYRQQDAVPVFVATVPVSGVGLAQSEVFAGAVQQPGTYLIYGYSIAGGIESDPSNSVLRKYTGKPLPPVLLVVQ